MKEGAGRVDVIPQPSLWDQVWPRGGFKEFWSSTGSSAGRIVAATLTLCSVFILGVLLCFIDQFPTVYSMSGTWAIFIFLCRVLALISLSFFTELRGWLSLMCDICSVPSVGTSVNLCWNSLIPTTCLMVCQGFICFPPTKFSITVYCWFTTSWFLVPNPIPSSPMAGTSGTA